MSEIKRQLGQPGGSPLDPALVARRPQLIVEGNSAAPAGSTTLEQAAAIMGAAFHGLDALARHCDLEPSASVAAQLAAVPFSEETLLRSRDTHVLVACARLSIMGLRAKAPDAFYFKRAWYADEDFARRPLSSRWRLIRKEPVPDSTSKDWARQQAVLAPDELVPGVAEMTLGVVLHRLETGERLLPSVYARTSDVDSSGRRIGLGRFGADGLRIRSFGGRADYYIGLAAARKSSWNRRRSPGFTVRTPTPRDTAAPPDPRPPAPRSARPSAG